MGFIQIPQKKRIKIKLANTKRLREARAKHKAWLLSQGLDDKTLKKRLKSEKSEDPPKPAAVVAISASINFKLH